MRRAAISVSPMLLLLAVSPAGAAPQQAAADAPNIRIEFNRLMHTRVVAKLAAKPAAIGEWMPSESISLASGDVRDFVLGQQKRERVKDQFGAGRRWSVSGAAASLRKTVSLTSYDDFPEMLVAVVEYTNTGSADLAVRGWTNHNYSIAAEPGAPEPAFWSYQSGSYGKRPDWVLPLKPGFRQENFQGMNATDYGGGTPVLDVWRRDIGVAIGHLETAPKLVSLPAAMPEQGRATIAISFKKDATLKPGQSLSTLRTFVAVHRGDHFQSLVAYRRAMLRQGFRFDPAPPSAFEPIWCAWGYGRDFTPKQVYDSLPVVKRLGFGWVTIDDGWQTAEGDWFLHPSKFPAGDRDMRAMVDRIHSDGFKAQLWWAPLAADPGTRLLEENPGQLLHNADGSNRKITWWNSWYLCPADAAVVERHQAFVVKALRDWDFDGLKLDGQHMNGVPPCHNPAHRHASPEAPVEALPKFFQAIYEAARRIKPDALVEFCPCGTAYSFFTLPYTNMNVASDPHNSWQVRLKGKSLKALAGDAISYFGDHVEMSDGGDDFASTLGIGGVVGTNFTWPDAVKKKLALTEAKEKHWAKWIKVYREKQLWRGDYLGALYDIGFDRPEAHAIRKDGRMYYAFYAREWKGPVELRGLQPRRYRVTDYDRGVDLGVVRGPVARIETSFSRHLLVEARPE